MLPADVISIGRLSRETIKSRPSSQFIKDGQLPDYLEYFHTDTGYLLSFHFNKHKETGIHEQKIGDKTIWEAVV